MLYLHLTALLETITFNIILRVSFLGFQVHIVIYYIKLILFTSQIKKNISFVIQESVYIT